MNKRMIKKEYLCLECGNTGRTYLDPKKNVKEGTIINSYCGFCDKDSKIILSNNIDIYKAKLSLKTNRTELEDEILNLLEERKDFNGRIR